MEVEVYFRGEFVDLDVNFFDGDGGVEEDVGFGEGAVCFGGAGVFCGEDDRVLVAFEG